jgi:hypothetical protein
MREVVRVPPAQLELLRSLPAWKGRVAAAHTIVRECRRTEYPIPIQSLSKLRIPLLLLGGGPEPGIPPGSAPTRPQADYTQPRRNDAWPTARRHGHRTRVVPQAGARLPSLMPVAPRVRPRP